MSIVAFCSPLWYKLFWKHAWIDSDMVDSYQSFSLPLILEFHVVWFDSWSFESYHTWVESIFLDFYHFFSLGLFFEVLNRFTHLWIVSIFIWWNLFWFKLSLIRINLHTSRLPVSTCLKRIRHLTNQIIRCFCENFYTSTDFYI